MPRPTNLHWRGEHAAERQTPQELRILKGRLRASANLTVRRVLRSARAATKLMAICDDYITWRKQKEGVVTTAAANRQLKMLTERAVKFSAAQEPLGSDLYDMQAMIAGLGDDATFKLRLKLLAAGLSLEAFAGLDAYTADWAALATASEAVLTVQHGAVKDQALIWTLDRLINLFEEVQKRPATHTPAYGADDTTGAPLSIFGRFAVTVMKSMDPTLRARRISTALEHLRKKRPPRPNAPGPKRKVHIL